MTPIGTPTRSAYSSLSGESTLKNVGWYSFAVPTLVCLLGTFCVLVILDVFYTPSNAVLACSAPASGSLDPSEVTADSPLHKYLPQYQNGYDYADGSYKAPIYGQPDKPALVFAPAPVAGKDSLSNDEYRMFSVAADDSVPVTLASAGADSIPSGETSEKRSASTPIDKTPQLPDVSELVRDITPSYVSSPSKEIKNITEEEMNALLTTEGKLFGKVMKKGMLPKEKWIPPKDPSTILKPLNKWLWDTLLGYENGEMPILPPGESPPKAGMCTLLFNPMYKFIVIKNTKVAGTSLFLKFGGFCPAGVTLEAAKKNPNCLWRVTDITRAGLGKLGYGSFEEMWEDYTVLALVRNPYDRAGSSYDYTLGRRKDRSGFCTDPSFKHFTSKPYVIGLQDTLFQCGDRVHDFYHVEPQHACLLDDKSSLVVDWMIRVNSLEQDLKPVLYALNRQRDPDVPRLKGGIGWEQRGPIADHQAKDDAEASQPEGSGKSRHAQKFVECGTDCVQNVNSYYRKDFELLQYTMEDFEN